MRKMPKEVVILAAKRTPFGAFGGALKDQTATDLAVHAAKAALAQAGAPADDSSMSSSATSSRPRPTPSTWRGTSACARACPSATPAVTVNRLCGSGFEAIVQARAADPPRRGRGRARRRHRDHVAGAARRARRALGPRARQAARSRTRCGSRLTDSYTGLPMAMTAENLAVQYKITQDEVDEFSVLSQKRFAAAQEGGRFDGRDRRPSSSPGEEGRDHRSPRTSTTGRTTTVEALAKLPKVFKKDGVIHAGAASGICDGAGGAGHRDARTYAKKKGLKPLARLLGWGVAGCDPKIMGIGPAPAIRERLAAVGDEAWPTSTSSR